MFTIQRKNVHLKDAYLFIPKGKTRYAQRNMPLTGAATEVLKSRLVSVKGAYLFPHRRDTSRPLTTIQKHMNWPFGMLQLIPHSGCMTSRTRSDHGQQWPGWTWLP